MTTYPAGADTRNLARYQNGEPERLHFRRFHRYCNDEVFGNSSSCRVVRRRVTFVVRGIIHADDSCAAGAPVGASLVRLASFSSVIGLCRDLIVDRAFVCSATSCVTFRWDVFSPTKVAVFVSRLASITTSIAKSSLRLARSLRVATFVAMTSLEHLLSDERWFAPLNVLRRGMPWRR